MMRMGKTYRRVMLMVLLMSAVLSAHAYQPAAAPASWRTTPTMSECPAYQFRSTSSFTPIVGQRSYTATEVYSLVSGPHKVKKDWEDEEDPVGQWDTPVGEPLIMLVMAVALLMAKGLKAKRRKELKQDRL